MHYFSVQRKEFVSPLDRLPGGGIILSIHLWSQEILRSTAEAQDKVSEWSSGGHSVRMNGTD